MLLVLNLFTLLLYVTVLGLITWTCAVIIISIRDLTDEDELIIIWSSKIKIIKASQNFQNHKKFYTKNS